MINFDNTLGLHKYQREDLENLLEEFPEIETTTVEELRKKYHKLYWEAAAMFEKASSLESKADTIELYIKHCRKETI